MNNCNYFPYRDWDLYFRNKLNIPYYFEPFDPLKSSSRLFIIKPPVFIKKEILKDMINSKYGIRSIKSNKGYGLRSNVTFFDETPFTGFDTGEIVKFEHNNLSRRY